MSSGGKPTSSTSSRYARSQIETLRSTVSGHGVLLGLAVATVLAVHALLGVGLGALVRNTTAAVTVALVWAFVVEGIAPVVLRSPSLTDILPVGAINAVLRTGGPATVGHPTPLAGLLLLLGYAAALAAASAVLDRGREV